MDFIDQIRVLATRITNTRTIIQTEEATKNAMIMPLIQILGYNVFDPLEVTPELVADVGTKKERKLITPFFGTGSQLSSSSAKKPAPN